MDGAALYHNKAEVGLILKTKIDQVKSNIFKYRAPSNTQDGEFFNNS